MWPPYFAIDGSTAQSVFPAIPATAPSADPDDDNALCYALESWVKLYASTKVAKLDNEDGLNTPVGEKTEPSQSVLIPSIPS